MKRGGTVETKRPSVRLKATPSSKNRSSDSGHGESKANQAARVNTPATEATTNHSRKEPDNGPSKLQPLGFRKYLEADHQSPRQARKRDLVSTANPVTADAKKVWRRWKREEEAKTKAAGAYNTPWDHTLSLKARQPIISEDTNTREEVKDRFQPSNSRYSPFVHPDSSHPPLLPDAPQYSTIIPGDSIGTSTEIVAQQDPSTVYQGTFGSETVKTSSQPTLGTKESKPR